MANLSYEEIIAFPEDTVSSLVNRFGFSFGGAMLRQIEIPSYGIIHSMQKTEEQIRDGSANLLLKSWRAKISASKEKSAFSILEAFGFDIYQAGNDLARGNCLLQDN